MKLPAGNGISAAVAAGAQAAGLVQTACHGEPDSAGAPRMEVIRDLAESLRDELAALTHSTEEEPSTDLAAEAALRCADLANLAACNLDGLPPAQASRAAAGVHLAAGAARALRLLAESTAGSDAALRDVRGAGWRVDLAIRQTEELLEARTRG